MQLPDSEVVAGEVRVRSGQSAPPVDPYAVARCFSELRVREENLDGEGVFVDLGAGRGEVLIRAGSDPLRKRFTLAHELGHYVLTRHVGIKEARASKELHKTMEEWCNGFAASLLMPRDSILTFLRRGGLSRLIDTVEKGPNVFGVSRSAFRMRIIKTTPMSIFVLDSQVNRVHEMYLSEVMPSLRWDRSLNRALSRMAKGGEEEAIVIRSNERVLVGQMTKRGKREFTLLLLPRLSAIGRPETSF